MNRRTFLKWFGTSAVVAAVSPTSVLAKESGVKIIDETPPPKFEPVNVGQHTHAGALTHSGDVSFSGNNYNDKIVMSTALMALSDIDCPRCEKKLMAEVRTELDATEQKLDCVCGFKGRAVYA